jgi:hypothetical protein
MSDRAVQCSVCQRPIEEPRHGGACDECGRPFHLNLRTDIEALGCGAAYVGIACGMSVYCDPCGARLAAAAASFGVGLARVG